MIFCFTNHVLKSLNKTTVVCRATPFSPASFQNVISSEIARILWNCFSWNIQADFPMLLPNRANQQHMKKFGEIFFENSLNQTFQMLAILR